MRLGENLTEQQKAAKTRLKSLSNVKATWYTEAFTKLTEMEDWPFWKKLVRGYYVIKLFYGRI